jgi:DNA-binding transcriptional ArsR family regulator
MVQYPLDATFQALADPTRRAILERLGRGSATISELAAPFEITLTGIKKHVRVLEQAELVHSEKVGRSRRCSIDTRGIEGASGWIEGYRRSLDARLDRLDEFLHDTKEEDR